MARLTDRQRRQGMTALHRISWATAVLAGLTSLALPATSVAQAPPPVNEADPAGNLLRKARGLLDLQKFRPAAADYQQFIQQYPNHPDITLARYSLAICHYRLGEFDATTPLLDQVVADAKFAQRDSAYAVLAHAHLLSSRYDKAVAAVDALLAQFPQSTHAEGAALQRVQALHAAGKFDPAATAASAFLKSYPQSKGAATAAFALGLSQKALNRDADAADTLVKLLTAHPQFDQSTDALLVLGQALEAQNKLDQAAERYRQMLAGASPVRQPDAHYSLGSALYRLGNHKESAEQFAAVLKLRPATPGPDGKVDKLAAAARLQLGLSQLAAKDLPAARKTLAAIVGVDTDNTPAARYGLAQCDLADGKYEPALATLEELARLPTPPVPASQLLFDKAGCLSQLNRHAEAAAAFETFIKQNAASPLLPEATYRQAFSLHQLAKYKESSALCAKLMAGEKNDFTAPAADLDAENYFLLGSYADAAKAYAALVAAAPSEDRRDRISLRLGQCAYSLGDFAKAVEHLTPLAAKPKAAADDVLGRGVFLLGDAHLQLKQYPAAIEAFEKYLSAIKAGAAEKADRQEAQYKLAVAQLRSTPEGAPAPAAVKQTLMAVAAGPAESQWTARGYFELGQLAYQAKPPRLDEAAASFAKVLAANSGKPPADLVAPSLYYLGWVDFDQNKPAAAAEKWAKVSAEHVASPVAADAAFFTGVALRKQDKHQAAIDALASYEKANPQGKRLMEARQLVAKSLIALDRNAEAAKLLATLSAEKSLQPDVVLYDLAWAQKSAKETSAAVATYRKLIAEQAASPLLPAARTELAALLMDDGKHAEAAELLQAVTAAQNVSAETRSAALYRLGQCQAKLQQPERAGESFAAFAKEFPADKLAAAALTQAGAGFVAAKRFDDAEKHFAELLKRFPDDTNAAYAQLTLGQVQADAGRFDASLASHQKYLQKFAGTPHVHEAQFGIGWAYENLRQYEKAREAYKAVTTKHQGEYAARAQFQIGETLLAEGKLEKAAEELYAVETVYAYPVWSARALLEAGKAYEQLKDIETARKLYGMVVSKYKEQSLELKQAQERLAQMK